MRSCFYMTPEDSRATALEYSPSTVRDHSHLRRWRPSDAAAVITMLVVLGFAATMLLNRGRGAGLSMFTVEYVSLLNMVDTSSQRLAHRVGLVLLSALCALGAAAITRPVSHVFQVTESLRTTHGFFKRWSGVFVAVGAVLVVLFNLRGTVFPGWQSRGLLLNYLLLSACLTILGLLWAERRNTRGLVLATWT